MAILKHCSLVMNMLQILEDALVEQMATILDGLVGLGAWRTDQMLAFNVPRSCHTHFSGRGLGTRSTRLGIETPWQFRRVFFSSKD